MRGVNLSQYQPSTYLLLEPIMIFNRQNMVVTIGEVYTHGKESCQNTKLHWTHVAKCCKKLLEKNGLVRFAMNTKKATVSHIQAFISHSIQLITALLRISTYIVNLITEIILLLCTKQRLSLKKKHYHHYRVMKICVWMMMFMVCSWQCYVVLACLQDRATKGIHD